MNYFRLRKLFTGRLAIGKSEAGKQSPTNFLLGEGSKLHSVGSIVNMSGDPSAVSIGRGSHVFGTLTVWSNCGKITVGDHVFIGEGTRVFSACRVHLGDRVQLAHGCTILDNNVHSLDPRERHVEFLKNISGTLIKMHDLRESPVTIKNDAWLGAGVIVLKGVTVGEGAVVGAGSVVTGDIPEFSVAAGNPARVIKRLAGESADLSS